MTSKVTGLTYKNMYCGICNKENINDLISWVWNLDCKGIVQTNLKDTDQSEGKEYNLLDIAR